MQASPTSTSDSPTAAAPRPSPDAAWRALHAAACAPYRAVGSFAWHFARGKLERDPVFRAMLERGDLAAGGHVVDIGCGQGLLASLLAACDAQSRAGRWPADWPTAPSGTRYTGIELMAPDIARARQALGEAAGGPRFVLGNMCTTAIPACSTVVIMDVLHYVDHAAQDDVLDRVHAALAPGGRLLLRVGDASEKRGFAISQWVDRAVALCRGHAVPPTWGRPLAEWIALLERRGFAVTPVPMSQGTPFANVLLAGVRR